MSKNKLKIYLCDLTYDTILLVSDTIPINIGFIASYINKYLGKETEISLFKYPNSAIEAIKKDAFDYLLKPINFIDLNDVIRKYEKKQEKNARESRVRSVLENFNVDSKEFNKLAIPTLDGYELVKISNILYCQAQDNYCNMFTYTGKEILISKTLKFVSEELLTQEVFVRIHKSYLVNLNYITSYARQDHNITLINGDVIPVSYRKNETLLNSILKKK